MITIGIDIGLADTGFAILSGQPDTPTLKDYGVIKTLPGRRIEYRLAEIAEDIDRLLEEWRPDLVAYEKPFFHGNNSNAGAVQNALGLVLAAAGANDIPTVFCTASEMKCAITGNGKAKKSEVRQALVDVWGFDIGAGPDDGWDAIGIAVIGRQKYQSGVAA